MNNSSIFFPVSFFKLSILTVLVVLAVLSVSSHSSAGPRWENIEGVLEYRGPQFNNEDVYLSAILERCVDLLTPRYKKFLQSQNRPSSNSDVRTYLLKDMSLMVQDWKLLPDSSRGKIEIGPDGNLVPKLRFKFVCGYGSA